MPQSPKLHRAPAPRRALAPSTRWTLGEASRLLAFFAGWTLVFALAKIIFIFTQPMAVRGAVAGADVWQVLRHGLPLDLATAAYLSVPVWLLTGLSLWVRIPGLRYIYKVYAALCAVVLSLVLVADDCLYGFWGIKLDATIWNYLAQPEGALQSVSIYYALGASVAFVLVCFGLYKWGNLLLMRRTAFARSTKGVAAACTAGWVVLAGLLFLCIRGGVGKSTANVGMVYFSERQFLNHAAVNPAFSLIASTTKAGDYGKNAQFFSEEERSRIFSMLHYSTESVAPDTLLSVRRPNVLLILMEGCGAEFVHAVNPEADPNITPNLNRIAAEGVVFTRCYANSFRTDRGTVCTLSGYPAFPDVSVMKLPARCATLPSIASSLRAEGYSTEFVYGGDINFTNTNGYLLSTGYERTFGDTSFPSSVRRTHDWGVTDGIMLDTLLAHIERRPAAQPWHIGALTLASHEPWKVPFSKIAGDEQANAFAYLDDCLGRFIDRLKQTDAWARTLVILVPDHGISYKDLTSDTDERKSHIPLIWTGGAVKGPRRVDLLCNQTDLAATLLGQMGIDHAAFRFSRDVLSRNYTHPSAVHAWSEGIYYMDATGISVVNLLTKPASLFRERPSASKQRTNAAKALLQTFYNDLK